MEQMVCHEEQTEEGQGLAEKQMGSEIAAENVFL